MLSAHVELGYITGFPLCRCRRRHAARIDKEKKEWTIIGSRAQVLFQVGRRDAGCSLTDCACAPHELHPPPPARLWVNRPLTVNIGLLVHPIRPTRHSRGQKQSSRTLVRVSTFSLISTCLQSPRLQLSTNLAQPHFTTLTCRNPHGRPIR